MNDDVRVITIDNPPVNALSFAYCAKLLAEVQSAEADPGIRKVVITGANGIFSAGADINDFAAQPDPNAITVRDVIAAIEGGKHVYVAAIDGSCMGGGLELALVCDYRIASERSKLGFPEIKLGLLPGAGGTQRLPRLIGAQEALQLMLKGETSSAKDAQRKGLIDRVAGARESVGEIARTADAGKRRISALGVSLEGLPPSAVPFVIAQAHKMCPPENNGGFGAHKLVDAVQGAFESVVCARPRP